MKREPSAFIDALPDLTIGLVGIPVAMSLQKIVEDIIPTTDELAQIEKSVLASHQLDGFIYFLFILLMYGIVSIGLLMLFEADRDITLDDPAWQKRLLLQLAIVSPFVIGLTTCLVLLGQSYLAEIRDMLPVLSIWSYRLTVTPALLAVLVTGFVTPIFLRLAFSTHVREHYETTFWYYAYIVGSLVAGGIGWYMTKT